MDEWVKRRRAEALAHPLRREMLELLDGADLSIRQLAEQLPDDPPVTIVNYHLAVLQDADAVVSVEGRYRRA